MNKPQNAIRSGLVIREPHVSNILDGMKTWELRGTKTKMRGKIALIKGGSGTVVGTCDLVDVVGPLTLEELQDNASKAGCKASDITSLYYLTTYAWVLRGPVRLPVPVPYEHPSGAVIWVNLQEKVLAQLGG